MSSATCTLRQFLEHIFEDNESYEEGDEARKGSSADPGPRLQVAERVPTESDVRIDPVRRGVDDINAEILYEVRGQDTSDGRFGVRLDTEPAPDGLYLDRLVDLARDARVRGKQIEARAMKDNELRKRAGWTGWTP